MCENICKSHVSLLVITISVMWTLSEDRLSVIKRMLLEHASVKVSNVYLINFQYNFSSICIIFHILMRLYHILPRKSLGNHWLYASILQLGFNSRKKVLRQLGLIFNASTSQSASLSHELNIFRLFTRIVRRFLRIAPISVFSGNSFPPK